MCTYIYFEVNCIFFLQDIVTSVVFIVCLFAGAEANAIYSSNNADNHDIAKLTCVIINTDLCDNLVTVRDAEAATAVSSSVKVKGKGDYFYPGWPQCDVYNCTVRMH